jgi:peptidoglycan/xylan/chitin deacetylase (PgdA/CDA1 family)
MLWPDRLVCALALTRRARLDVEWANESHDFDLRDDARKIDASRRLLSMCKALPQADRVAFLKRVLDRLGVEESRLASAWDDQRPLDPSELKKLPEAGIEIGSHTCSHPIVARLDAQEAKRELGESKRLIEASVGRPCVDFAYPNGGPGDFNDQTHLHVMEAGYRSAVTTIKRRVTRSDGRFEIPRCTLTHNRITMAEFASEVSGFPGTLRAAKHRIQSSRDAAVKDETT